MQKMKLMGLAAALSTLIASSAMAQYADPNYWVGLGDVQFRGPNDQQMTFAGWGGRSVDKIGLKALGDEGNCPRARVTFGNGRTLSLNVGRLPRDHIVVFDLPGRDRNITAIDLACHAMNKRRVGVQIFVRK